MRMPSSDIHHPSKSSASYAYFFSTSIGLMAIAWRGAKIIATQLPEKNEGALLRTLRLRLGDSSLVWSSSPPAFVLTTAGRIKKHLSGDIQKFQLDYLAIDGVSPFFRSVYEWASKIPSGQTTTYGALAREAGSPKAARAVGQAMAKNPFPLIVPCHRVIGGNKALVGFSAHGGLSTKERLLQLESKAYAGSTNYKS